jgi:pilus assembly protein Flp/PilA
MRWLVRVVNQFTRDEIGASLGEYALLLACIMLVCIGAVSAFGTNLSTIFAGLGSTV